MKVAPDGAVTLSEAGWFPPRLTEEKPMSNLLEFFRPEHLRPVDSDGFELPPWENPYFAIPSDDNQVDDAQWPDGRWELGPEPSEADSRWAAENLNLPAPISGGA